MGQSTDAQLWYGFTFEDGYKFPWAAEPFDGDLEEWWRKEQGFVPPENVPYGELFDAERAFDKEHPCPAELITHCSGEYPMYGLAVRGSEYKANRGYPILIEGLGLSQGEIEPLKKFCERYELTPEGEIGWWLTSYWG